MKGVSEGVGTKIFEEKWPEMFQIPKSCKLRDPKCLMNPKHKKNEENYTRAYCGGQFLCPWTGLWGVQISGQTNSGCFCEGIFR